MNLALQKRNEQLERWRQNEANVELLLQQQQQTAADTILSDNTKSSIQKISSLDRTISTSRLPSTRNNCDTAIDYPPTRKRSNRREKSNSDLQVKFSDETLFLTACANGDICECERLLSDNSVDINVTTTDGLTGLHEAAICGNAKMVEYLIEQGADINCCDNEGWTPLHAAASLGHVKTVETLLDCGADVTIVNCENLLAYDLVRNDQVQALIGEHLQGVDIDYLRTQEERAIQEDIKNWIQTGHYEERSHPVTNATVLHVLAAKGHINLMKQILESPVLKRQINLEARDIEGFTPLLAASFWSQTDIVEILIEHGADIFAQANNGYKISSIVSI